MSLYVDEVVSAMKFELHLAKLAQAKEEAKQRSATFSDAVKKQSCKAATQCRT